MRCVVAQDITNILKVLAQNKGLEIFDIPNTKPIPQSINEIESIKNVKIFYNTDRI